MSLRPPWTAETAHAKVKLAQNLWNTRNPAKVVLAYTPNTVWRNRNQFLRGSEEVLNFLEHKWTKEQRYRLKKELFAFSGNRIAVQFWYEYCPDFDQDPGSWRRCYGLEDWTFAEDGKMYKRQMSGNEIEITNNDRWFKDGMTEDEIDEIKLSDEHH